MSDDSTNQALNEAQSTPIWGWLYSFPARMLSLLGALSLTTLMTIFPNAVATSINDINHSLLTTMMLGIAAGLVHGVGFVPKLTFFKILFGPVLGWLLMGYGIYMTWLAH